MYKNKATGFYEADFRRKEVPRLHLSYGVSKKDEATRLHGVVLRLFREKQWDLIERLRRGEVSVHQLAATADTGKPLDAVIEAAAAPWPTVREAIEDYLDWLRLSDRKAKGTARAAKAQLVPFEKFIGSDTRVDAVTPTMVTEYQRAQFASDYAQNTVTQRMWRVSGLYTFLAKREVRLARDEERSPRALASPIDPDEVTTRVTRRERYLSEDEAARLLGGAPPMLLFPVMAGLYAGLRVEETLHLRTAFDVDLDLGLITIQEQPTWHPKNRKRRVVPMAAELRTVLEYHLEHFASDEWVTPSLRDSTKPFNKHTFDTHFARIVESAELTAGRVDPTGVVYHTLRHTFASWLVMAGTDLFTVSQLLGNSLKQVEQTYAHLAPDFRQRAVDRLSGLVAIPSLDRTDESPEPTTGAQESATETATTEGE